MASGDLPPFSFITSDPMIRTITALIISFTALSPAFGNPFPGSDGNLITNGGFEVPTVTGSDQEFSAPSTAIEGWTVTAGSIDLVTSGSILGTAHSGLQMIDINGSQAGALEQSFSTVPGRHYRLDVYYSNNPNSASAEPSYSARVAVIGVNQLVRATVTHAEATEFRMNWLLFTREFMADSTSTKLVLSSVQGGYNGVYFDSVSVVPTSIPEPASVALIATAATCAAFASRRLRRPQG